MKNIILLFILGNLFIACQKEETLTPSEMKNWFTIEYQEGMDCLDSCIYEIWNKYNVPVFYHDTLGREDRGWRTIQGDTIWYYEVLNVTYDMTEDANRYRIKWNPVDVSTSEERVRLLPVLDWLSSSLDMIKNTELVVPCVFLTKNYSISRNYGKYESQKVARGFNFIAIGTSSFNTSVSTKRAYMQEFVQEVCSSVFEDLAQGFYKLLVENLGISEPWGVGYSGYDSSNEFGLYPKYREMFRALNDLKDYDNKVASWRRTYDRLISWGMEESAQQYLDRINNLTYYKEHEEEVRAEFDLIRPEHFGIIETGTSDGMMYVPSKEKDLNLFLNEIFSNPADVFYERYKDFPAIIKRYNVLRNGLLQLGIELDALFAE